MSTTKEKSLVEKLQSIQTNLKTPKWQFNSFGKYKYRSCEDILEAVKPLLAEYNCILTIQDDIIPFIELDRVYVKATAILKDDSKSEPIMVTAFAREEKDKKWMDSSQITWAASSYARKYALNWLFLIDDTKDADATNTHETSINKPVAKQVVTKPTTAQRVQAEWDAIDKIIAEVQVTEVTEQELANSFATCIEWLNKKVPTLADLTKIAKTLREKYNIIKWTNHPAESILVNIAKQYKQYFNL